MVENNLRHNNHSSDNNHDNFGSHYITRSNTMDKNTSITSSQDLYGQP